MPSGNIAEVGGPRDLKLAALRFGDDAMGDRVLGLTLGRRGKGQPLAARYR